MSLFALRTTLGTARVRNAIPVVFLTDHEHNHRTAMTYVSGKWNLRNALLRALWISVVAFSSSLLPTAARASEMVPAEEICLPKGTYPMIGGGTTVFSHDQTCFSRPVTNTFPWEKKIPRANKSAVDQFNAARVVRYDYHDALYQCAKRHMRLPAVEELSALFVYANTGNNAATESKYAIVAPENNSRYPGGLHGWGGSSAYWSRTFAGRGFHKVVNLKNGRVSIYYDSRTSYVSCVH
jgi:hypothetical protein